MEPHADQQMETADQVLVSLGGTFLVQDEHIPAVFHSLRHLIGQFPVRRELEGHKDNLGLEPLFQFIRRPGKFPYEPFFSLPVPEGKAHQRPGRIHPQFFQEPEALLFPAFRKGEHRIAGHMDGGRIKAHGFQIIQGPVVPDGDQIRLPAHQPGKTAAEPAPDGADALGKQHDFLPHDRRQGNQGKIIVEAQPAGHVLEQAAASGKEQIRPGHGPADSRQVEPMDRLHRMEPGGDFRIPGDHRQLHLGILLFQAGYNGREHGLVSGIGKPVIAGNQDLTQRDSSSLHRTLPHGDTPGRRWQGQ